MTYVSNTHCTYFLDSIVNIPVRLNSALSEIRRWLRTGHRGPYIGKLTDQDLFSTRGRMPGYPLDFFSYYYHFK